MTLLLKVRRDTENLERVPLDRMRCKLLQKSQETSLLSSLSKEAVQSHRRLPHVERLVDEKHRTFHPPGLLFALHCNKVKFGRGQQGRHHQLGWAGRPVPSPEGPRKLPARE